MKTFTRSSSKNMLIFFVTCLTG